jgi:hypothetical protein
MLRALNEFLFGRPVTITTTLSPEECGARCAERTVQGLFGLAFSAFSGKPAMGEVSTYDLRWRKNARWRDYFYQIELNAQFRYLPGGAGTRVECEIGGGFFFWWGAIIAPVLLLGFFLFSFVRAAFEVLVQQEAHLGMFHLSHAVMFMIPVAMLGVAIHFCRSDREFLLDLLHQTVGGQMLEAPLNKVQQPTVAR